MRIAVLGSRLKRNLMISGMNNSFNSCLFLPSASSLTQQLHIERFLSGVIKPKLNSLIKGVSFLRNCGAASVGEYNRYHQRVEKYHQRVDSVNWPPWEVIMLTFRALAHPQSETKLDTATNRKVNVLIIIEKIFKLSEAREKNFDQV